MDAGYFYLDIGIEKYINSELTEHIAFTDWVIRITVAVPEELSGADDYAVVRIHEEDGEIVVTILDTIVNEDGTLTFETDEFSTYAIVALSTVETGSSASDDAETGANLSGHDADETGDSSSTEDTSGAADGSPETADNSAPICMMMLLMLCAVCGCAILVVRRRRA